MKAMEWTETFSATETEQKISVKEISTRRMYEFFIPNALPFSLNHPLLSWRHFFEGSTPDDPEHPEVVEDWLASEKCYVFIQFPWFMRKKTRAAYFDKWTTLGYQAKGLDASNGSPACWLVTKPGCLADDFMPYEAFVDLIQAIETEWGQWLFGARDREYCQAYWSTDYATLCWQRFALKEDSHTPCSFLDAPLQRLPLLTVIRQDCLYEFDLTRDIFRTCQRDLKRGHGLLSLGILTMQGLACYALQSLSPVWVLLLGMGLLGLLLVVAMDRFIASTAQTIQLLLIESSSISLGVVWLVVTALMAR